MHCLLMNGSECAHTQLPTVIGRQRFSLLLSLDISSFHEVIVRFFIVCLGGVHDDLTSIIDVEKPIEQSFKTHHIHHHRRRHSNY